MFYRLVYPIYRRASSSSFWMRRRFTRAGWLMLAGLWFTAALGVDTTLSVAYQAFVLIFILMGAAVVMSPFGRPRFSVRRLLPRFATAGIPTSYRLQFKNESRRVQRSLALIDQIQDPDPRLAAGNSRSGERMNHPPSQGRWRRMLAARQLARVPETPLPPCPPLATIETEVPLTPLRRGILRFERLTAAAPDPLGLFRAFRSVAAPGALTILPRRYPVARLPLPGSLKYQHGGVTLAGSVGESEEFVSLRDYRPGDPMRRIHWKSWAKAGKPIVKEFQQEFFVRHALILDTFAPNPMSSLFEEAVSVAASFACALETQDSLLDLMFVGPNAYCFTAGRGVAHTEQMLEILASVAACTARPFVTLADLVLEHSASLSSCVCVFIAWDQPRWSLIEQLRARSVPVSVYVIAPPHAAGPEDPGPMRDCPGDFRVLKSGDIAAGLASL